MSFCAGIQLGSGLSPLRVSRWEGHPNEEANAIWALMLEQTVERDTRLAKYALQTPSVGLK
jgi:hypothetical protein